MSWIEDPGLAAAGVEHGFGVRGLDEPAGLVRPRQVHGSEVAWASAQGLTRDQADAVMCADPGVAVAVVTADCVPILVSAGRGVVVGAIHAGWRGLSAGVVRAGVNHLKRWLGPGEGPVRAAIGPHIGPCCYEVDGPVIEPLRSRFGEALEEATRPSGSDRVWLDLAMLVRRDLVAAGVDEAAIGTLPDACTRCNSERFHSYRRDGPRAGRLVHWIATGSGLDTPRGSA